MLLQRLVILSMAAGLPLIAPLALVILNAFNPSPTRLDFAVNPLAPQYALFGIATAALIAFSPLPRFRFDIIGIPLLAALLGSFGLYSRPGPLSLAILAISCVWAVRRLERQFLDKFVRASVLIASAVATYGLAQAAWNRLIAGLVLVNPFGERILSTLGNPTFLADYLSLHLPMALFLSLAAHGRFRLLGWGACAAAIAAAIVLTGSKGGQIAAAVSSFGLLVYAARRRKINLPRMILLGSLLILTIVILLSSPTPLKFSLSRWIAPGESFSYSQRTAIFRGASALLAQSPLFGHGPGSFPVLFPRVQPQALHRELGVALSVNHAHNDYLELAADLGIPALGIVIALAILCLSAPIYHSSSLGLNFGLLAACIAMLSNFPIYLPASLFCIAVFAGLLLPRSSAGAALPDAPTLRLFRFMLAAWFGIGSAVNFLATGWYDLGNKALAARNYDIAGTQLARAAVLAPRNRHVWQNLGRAQELKKEWPQAIEAYAEAARLGPFHAITHLNLGRTERSWYFDARDASHIERSIHSLSRSIGINPYSFEPREWGGELALESENRIAASLFLEDFPADFIPTPKLLWLRAKWMLISGRPEESRAAMQAGDEMAAQAEIARAEAKLASGSADEAERIVRNLTERFPELPLAWEALGYVLSSRGKLAEARDCFALIAQIAPQSVPAYLNVALLSINIGDLVGARTAWEAASRLRPDDVEVRLTHARLLAREGRASNAKTEYKWILKHHPQNIQARKELETLSGF